METELSTSELFHYTRSFENLLSIINNGFYPSYVYEFTYLSDIHERKLNCGPIPMVSFCDIPVQLIKNHSDRYGNYAIGLTKQWGINNGINPVFYIQENSIVGDSLAAFATNVSKYDSSMISADSDDHIFKLLGNILKAFGHISCFVKPVERLKSEEIVTHGHPLELEARKFYDEREWRFVPIWNERLDVRHIPHEDYFNKEKLNHHNREIRKYAIQFKIEEISHIFYKDADEKRAIIKALEIKYNIDFNTVESKPKLRLLA